MTHFARLAQGRVAGAIGALMIHGKPEEHWNATLVDHLFSITGKILADKRGGRVSGDGSLRSSASLASTAKGGTSRVREMADSHLNMAGSLYAGVGQPQRSLMQQRRQLITANAKEVLAYGHGEEVGSSRSAVVTRRMKLAAGADARTSAAPAAVDAAVSNTTTNSSEAPGNNHLNLSSMYMSVTSAFWNITHWPGGSVGLAQGECFKSLAKAGGLLTFNPPGDPRTPIHSSNVAQHADSRNDDGAFVAEALCTDPCLPPSL